MLIASFWWGWAGSDSVINPQALQMVIRLVKGGALAPGLGGPEKVIVQRQGGLFNPPSHHKALGLWEVPGVI